jgi:hypothetical protein
VGEEVEYLNPMQLIRSPRMINGWICSCLSERDETLGSPLVWRNCISIIEVEKGGKAKLVTPFARQTQKSCLSFVPGLSLGDNHPATLITGRNNMGLKNTVKNLSECRVQN